MRAESLGSELIVYFDPPGSAANSAPGSSEPVAEATDQLPDATPRLLTARLERMAGLRQVGPGRLSVDPERLYFFDADTGEAIGSQLTLHRP